MRVHVAVVCSVLSSTGIVFLNKWLFTFDDFSFPATLTGWHLLVTHVVLACASRLGVFTRRKLSWRARAWFSILDALAMALQNLSLNRNSVSFYQTCKLFTIPVIVAIEKALGKDFPKPSVVLALALITVGVTFSTGANFDTNAVGVFIGLGSTVTTAMVVVSTTWLQKLHELSSSQLLHNVAIVDGVILTTFGPMLDYHISDRLLYIDYTWTTQAKVVFALTCGAAVLVNCVTFYLLGKISPVSYQIIGQAKTLIIYAVGYYFFDKEVSRRSSLGAVTTFLGCIVYARLSLQNDVAKSGVDVVVKSTTSAVPEDD